MRKEGCLALDLWQLMLGRKVELNFWDDNQTCATTIKTGKTKELPQVHRVHGVSISAMHDFHKQKVMNLKDCHVWLILLLLTIDIDM